MKTKRSFCFALFSLIRNFAGMFGNKNSSKDLLASIREGREMTRAEKLRLIVSLSIPSILAQISATVMFFIDASMVGPLGARASAAIGLVETTGWLIGGLSMAVNMGFSVQVAHAIGANDMQRARRILRQSLVCCLLFSIAISLVALSISIPLPHWLGGSDEIAHDASLYFALIGVFGIFFQMEGLAGSMLKCSGNMKIPSVLNIMMCAMDVVFNYIFIYILNLGVMGAALGTGLAELITAGLMLYFLLVRSDLLGIFRTPKATGNSNPADSSPVDNNWQAFRPTADIVRKAFAIGGPMGLQHLLMGSAQIVSTLIVAPLGTVAIAAHSLAITVESLCYMPGYGIAEAATTLVGQSFGAGKHMLTRQFARMSVALGIGVMTLMGVLMWVMATELMGIMTPVADIIAIGTRCLRIEAFAEPMFAAAIVCNGVFVGAGDTLRPAIMSLASMWGVRLTLAALLAGSYGLPGVWTAMAIELTFRGLIFLARLFHGSWLKGVPATSR
jgi:putative MATE family efflux protein